MFNKNYLIFICLFLLIIIPSISSKLVSTVLPSTIISTGNVTNYYNYTIGGTNGTNGTDGHDGSDGTNGIDGINGTNGIDGINGTNGIDGINGTNGTNGIDGINGTFAGILNETQFNDDGQNWSIDLDWFLNWISSLFYTKGEIDLMIPFVINGTNGTNGTNGIDGINGTNGIDGINGTNGIDGINGTNGIDGINGTNGADGHDGEDGIDGINGTNGINGINGTFTGILNTTQFNDDGQNWSIDETWLDTIYLRIANLVGLVGNWSEDKVDYLTKANTEIYINANVTSGNTTLKNWIDAQLFTTNATMNKSVSCSSIIGGSDGDYCADATGSGSGWNFENVTIQTTNIYSSFNNQTRWNLTTLTMQLKPLSYYEIVCDILSNSTAVTTGARLRANTTGTPTSVLSSYCSPGSASAIECYSGTSTTSNEFLDLGNTATSVGIGSLISYVNTSASEVTYTIEFQSELYLTGRTELRAGTTCKSVKVA